MQLVLIVSVLNLLLSPRLGNIYLNMNILVEFLTKKKVGTMSFSFPSFFLWFSSFIRICFV